MLSETNGAWTLTATSAAITRICLDSRLSLLLNSELGDAEIQCSGEFRVVDRERGIDTTASAANADVLGVGSLRGDLACITITRDGKLQIDWTSGMQLIALPDDRFEAWEVVTDQLQLVCLPGGGIAVFDAHDHDPG